MNQQQGHGAAWRVGLARRRLLRDERPHVEQRMDHWGAPDTTRLDSLREVSCDQSVDGGLHDAARTYLARLDGGANR